MQKGTYILLLHLPADVEIEIPGVETQLFPAGFYAYADGADNLPERIKTYLMPAQNPTRHIDILRQFAPVAEVWMAINAEPHPHAWVDLLLAIPGGVTFADGFGATGCNCDSHLVYFDVRPELDDFQIGVRGLFPAETVIQAKVTEL